MILEILGTNDLTELQLQGQYGKVSIFNIYNDYTHSRNKIILKRYIQEHANSITNNKNHHMIWAGDFNQHHPIWDDNQNTHLFTAQAARMAENLIKLIVTYDLIMPLSKGIPMLKHMVTKRYSKLDNIFCIEGLKDLIVTCKVNPTIQPTSIDHFPIITKLLIPQE